MRLNSDRIIALVFLLFGIVFFYKSFDYPDESTIYVRFILSILMILSALLLVKSNKPSDKTIKQLFTKDKIISICLMLAYVILIPILGFFVSTFVFLIGFMWVFKHKGLAGYLIAAVIASISVYIVFQKFLSIWFPTGLII